MRNLFRKWVENLETFALEVVFEEKPGKRAALLRNLLYLLSQIFDVGVKIRRYLYKVRIIRDTTIGVQVIAVGNLTVGGTGKTPVVEKLARELQLQGRTVAILSRGYRSKPIPLWRGF
jgi:tetraacyldisaccharide 4'-kinase